MSYTKEEALKQIDRALQEVQRFNEEWSKNKVTDTYLQEVITLLSATLGRVAPRRSQYTQYISGSLNEVVPRLAGLLKALRRDIDDGLLETLEERVRAGVWGDLLASADELVNYDGVGAWTAAAVLAGGVLESHVKGLSEKSGISTLTEDGEPVKFQRLIEDLKVKNVIDDVEFKDLVRLYGLRKPAAHGEHEKIKQPSVRNMIDAVRIFLRHHPA